MVKGFGDLTNKEYIETFYVDYGKDFGGSII
jgi:hypothetical protein